MRKLRKIVLGLVLVYVLLVAGLLVVMREPIVFGKVMSKIPEKAIMVVPFRRLWFIARAGRLQVGDLAPEFNLVTADGKERFNLASLRGQKPVVLIFGSYT